MDGGSLKNTCHVVGSRQTLRALKEKEVSEVILAQDANPYVVSDIKALCQQKNVPVTYVESMNHLGNSCGIDRPAAAVAIINNSE
jgi:large subunit ribosomal protein L7A